MGDSTTAAAPADSHEPGRRDFLKSTLLAGT